MLYERTNFRQRIFGTAYTLFGSLRAVFGIPYRRDRQRLPSKHVWLLVVDALVLNGSFIGAFLLRFSSLETIVQSPHRDLWLIINAVWLYLALFFLSRLFGEIGGGLFKQTQNRRRLVLLALHLGLVSVVLVITNHLGISRTQFGLTYLLFWVVGTLVGVTIDTQFDNSK